mmetsp:Transcript_3165/g.7113  ORF Transcript_3165/g.7113 Transcript_3165/m.7113 type:complete len:367 (-) Transcript_3165:628-1728(-)|eukprot:CAMPEP_0171561028 /NCGR_PEP_ID=MMETSP0960-20121227/14052_1 /TAXON_ID=87120 /ORGANISM="Aurantiochytrium limacinum, Strain ATCCMYA-1381" /LENGTH=366 /DNA_ID=CAMNT_0012113349 /DNA_START=81 /DNA_END=1181 /DNA_ORIENTATION=-
MCKSCARSLLTFFDGLMILVGLGVVAISSYLIAEQYKHEVFGSSSYLTWAIWIPFCVGWLIVILSGIACCVTISNNRCCLGFFGFLQILCTIIVIAAGIFFMVFDHYSDLTAHTGVGDLKKGLGGSLHMLYDFQLGVYEGCCGALIPKPDNCSNPVPTGIFDYCILSIPNTAYESGLDADQAFCDSLNDENSLDWCAGAEGSLSDAPTVAPTMFPTTLRPTAAPVTPAPTAALGVNETYAPTVTPTDYPTTLAPTGVPTSGWNPSGDEFHSFQVAWYNYLHNFLFPAGIAFLCFGFVTFLTSVMSCCLACKKRDLDGDYEKVGANAGASKRTQDQHPKEAELTALKKDEDEDEQAIHNRDETLTMA